MFIHCVTCWCSGDFAGWKSLKITTLWNHLLEEVFQMKEGGQVEIIFMIKKNTSGNILKGKCKRKTKLKSKSFVWQLVILTAFWLLMQLNAELITKTKDWKPTMQNYMPEPMPTHWPKRGMRLLLSILMKQSLFQPFPMASPHLTLIPASSSS